jgi:acetolactate synthase-1/2/3 large subunit
MVATGPVHRMTGGQAVVEALRAHGVKAIFGIASVHTLPIYDALYDAPEMRLIVPRHEGAAAAMADGYFRATGRVGVCLTSTGPGAANSCGAMLEAYGASSQVLHITSQIPTEFLDRGKGFLHEASGQLQMLEPFTGYRRRITSVEDIPAVLRQAFTSLQTERPRPAVVEIPVDLQSTPAEIATESPGDYPPAEPDPTAITQAAELLRTAQRPIVWAGGGVINAGASSALIRLAEWLDAPVLTTISGRGAVPEDHPLCLGNFATARRVRDFIASCDVMLALGTRFSASATGRWTLQIPPNLIHVDLDAANFDLNYPTRVRVRADAKAALQALIAQLEGPLAGAHDRPEILGLRQQVRSAARSRLGQHEPVMDGIRAVLEREAIVVCDSTIPAYFWGNHLLEIYEPRTSISPHGSVAIGLAFPLALGCKAGQPDRQVVLIQGDGGFMLHATELATAVQYGLNVVVLLFNDSGYGILRRIQDRDYRGRRIGVDLHAPDFVSFAESFGAAAFRVTEPSQTGQVLARALSCGRPALIELQLSGPGPG